MEPVAASTVAVPTVGLVTITGKRLSPSTLMSFAVTGIATVCPAVTTALSLTATGAWFTCVTAIRTVPTPLIRVPSVSL